MSTEYKKKSPYDGITGEQMDALPLDKRIEAWERMVERAEEKLKIAIDTNKGQKVVEHYQKLVEETKMCLEDLGGDYESHKQQEKEEYLAVLCEDW